MKGSLRCLAAALAVSPAAAIVPWSAVFHGLVDSSSPSRDKGSIYAASTYAEKDWKAHNFSVPIDHFHNDSTYEPHADGLYPLRYWFDASHYKEGGPVIVLHAGELDAAERIPYVAHGIGHILAEATNGIAVLMEHRYYGTSFPTPDLSVDNLRFLSTEQAMADSAYFARNIQFPGLEHLNLTAPETAWIMYGGSYAGAFAAFMRKIYPDAFWGAISGSGVPEAIVDYWEYFEAARMSAPGECAPITQKMTHVIDTALFSGDSSSKSKQVKDLFGLSALDDGDFADTISRGIEGLQSTIWDPEVDVYDFGHYCGAVTSDALLYASTRHLVPAVKELVAEAGYGEETDKLAMHMVNYIGYVRSYLRQDLNGQCKNRTKLECFSRRGQIDRIDFGAGWARSWAYQVCTQWGYFVTGSGVPSDQLPLVSRAITLDYASQHCRTVFNITAPPNIDSINKMGGFNFSYPRLAFVDGAQDPWRAAGVHRVGLQERKSTVSEPYILVDWGVHHWDEYGVGNVSEAALQPDYPPAQVLDVQRREVEFVRAWMEEFEEQKARQSRMQDEEEAPGEL